MKRPILRVPRVSRVGFTLARPRRIVAGMTFDPLPSLADLLAEADHIECDALALRRAFPRAVARVLHLAARSGPIGHRAASLNTELSRAGVAHRVTIAPTEPPVAIVGLLWAELLDVG